VQELEIESIRVRPETSQRAVVLKVKDSNLFLPIFIGQYEVEAIRLKLLDVTVPRPMTHDLLGSVIGNLGGKVSSIVVSELKEDTFFAKIIVECQGNVLEVDARPSDAIALAVRTNSPIYAEESVIEKAGIALDQDTEAADSGSLNNEDSVSVDDEELEKLSAYSDFIDTLDLEEI
jgi:bifunctional DNase/RNase